LQVNGLQLVTIEDITKFVNKQRKVVQQAQCIKIIAEIVVNSRFVALFNFLVTDRKVPRSRLLFLYQPSDCLITFVALLINSHLIT